MPTSVPNGTITFPLFGEGFAFTASESFKILGLTLHWYGVIIAVGFILAFLYADYYRKHTGLRENDFWDYLLWTVPSAIIGSRIYYVIFNFSLYKDNPLDIVKTWNGGLAIYGGVIGAAIALFVVSKVKKIPFAMSLDVAAPGLLIGQAVGRWGNFINRECFGAETNIFIRMGLTDSMGKTIYVHPVFLYESLWNLLGLLLIHIYTKKKGRKYDGQVFAFYLAWYGFIRMLVEGLRTDSLYLFGTGIRVSQLLAALTFLGAAVILCYNGSKKHPLERLYVNAPREDKNREAKDAQENSEAQEAQESQDSQAQEAQETREVH